MTVNWCTRKDGVSQDSLIARHRTYRDGLTDDAAMQWWGIGYPSAGHGKVNFQASFITGILTLT